MNLLLRDAFLGAKLRKFLRIQHIGRRIFLHSLIKYPSWKVLFSKNSNTCRPYCLMSISYQPYRSLSKRGLTKNLVCSSRMRANMDSKDVSTVTDVIDDAVGVAKGYWLIAIGRHNLEKKLPKTLTIEAL